MAWRSIILALMVACAALCAPAAAQTGPVNDVPITISWQNVGPSHVAFQGVVGQPPFARHADRFEGRRPTRGAAVYHDVALTYGAEEIPLRLLTRFDMPGVPLRIEGPAQLGCSDEDIRALESVSPTTSPQATRLRTLIQARHLLFRTTSACYAPVRPRLARVYFNMSCSLASETDYFLLSREVAYQYVLYAADKAQARADALDCDNPVRERNGRALDTRRVEARQRLDYRGAREISDEMARLARDPEWRDSFEAIQLDPDQIRGFQIQDMDDLQVHLGHGIDIREAIRINQEIDQLRGNPSYRRVLNSRAITRGLLQHRGATLQQRLEQQQSRVQE